MRSPVVALILVAACGGGTTVAVGSTNDQPPSSVDTPPSSVDPAPTTGFDTPPSTIDNPGGGSAGAGLPLCSKPPAAVTACVACLETSCSSAVAGVAASCTTYLACFSACDCSKSDCLSACNSSATAACSTQASALYSCSATDCANACTDSVSIGPADAGAVTIGTPGGGGSGCSKLAACCSSLPSFEQSGCTATVNLDSASTCDQALSGYKTAGLCH